MLSEHNYDRKPDVVLIDADFSNDPLLCNDILNKFHENISEESNPNVISYITYPHNAFDSCEKLFHSKSIAVYPCQKVTSNVYSSQCEKYVSNEATSFITWRYKDPTLFRGGEDSVEKSVLKIIDSGFGLQLTW
ncbi:unnamed protein product [Schistosoma curassoni]|uniref:Response regulatory domain-containing protein n=1 Tax=Schistosoma curassoni TaxID=6186 RepID=A0A183L6V3_9TREM|nr:unnamed protein product [Schistosoma curassoni]